MHVSSERRCFVQTRPVELDLGTSHVPMAHDIPSYFPLAAIWSLSRVLSQGAEQSYLTVFPVN